MSDEPRIVYVVVGSWSYEGYYKPEAVFATKALADEHAAQCKTGYDWVDVIEMPILSELPNPPGAST